MTDIQRATIHERLAALYAKHGRLTPALVVRDAKNPASPMHDVFEWDDGKAARLYREEQARALIRTVTVKLSSDVTVVATPVYVRDPSAGNGEQGYVSVEALRGDRAMAREALMYECGRAASMVERARHLAVALGLTSEVEAALAGITSLRERAEAA